MYISYYNYYYKTEFTIIYVTVLCMTLFPCIAQTYKVAEAAEVDCVKVDGGTDTIRKAYC